MPDREKVIDGLIMLKRFLPSTMWEPINDSLALLKEHEAVKPITEDYMYKCGYCKWSFFSMNPTNILSMMQAVKFCPHCGKPIAWEGR